MAGGIAFLDVAYSGRVARAACVLADDWSAEQPTHAHAVSVDEVADYEPGEFYKRELPCLLKVLEALPTGPHMLVIDGYVWLDADGRPGLGAHLYDARGRRHPVVGIAKTAFVGAKTARNVVAVLRGTSNRPLFVTAAGVEPEVAGAWVRAMHGAHRIPTLLAEVDRLARDSRARSDCRV